MHFPGHYGSENAAMGGGKKQPQAELSLPAWCCSVRRIRIIVGCFILFNVLVLLLAAVNSGTMSRVRHGGGLWTDLCQHCGGGGHNRDASYRDIAADIFHLPLLENSDMSVHYYPLASAGNAVGKWCFRRGSLPAADSEKAGKCLCARAYYGADCGIPQVVWNSSFLEAGTRHGAWVRRRIKPRRLLSIAAVTGPTQLDFLRLQIAYLQPVVDVFVIADKTSRLLADIERTFGGREEYTRIVYLPLKDLKNSSVAAEDVLQQLFWKRLSDFRLDDLLVWTDLTTVPLAEALLFLKLYEGFSEPVYLNVRRLAYSFLWESKPGALSDNAAEPNSRQESPFVSSFAVLSVLCRYNLSCATPPKAASFPATQLEAFTKNHGWAVERWTLGTSSEPSGWNCKSCVTFPDSSLLFPEGSMNGSAVTNEEWRVTLMKKLMEQGFHRDNVQLVNYSDPRYLAPQILLEKPGSLWYLVPLHLKAS
uniref:Putative glycosyltransferase family 17 n=1 Tax=Amblyomma aureolatum TaxID=187763 RepID=A0A1E1XA09_9ACAR